jgi:hypothetical protein
VRLPEIKILKIPVATGRIKTWTLDGYIALPADHPNRSLAKVIACRAMYRGDVSIKGAADRFATLESLCLADRGRQNLAMADYEGRDREAVLALLIGTLGDLSQINWTHFLSYLDGLRST